MVQAEEWIHRVFPHLKLHPSADSAYLSKKPWSRGFRGARPARARSTESPSLLADKREISELRRFPFDPLIPEADDPTSMNLRNQAGFTWIEVLVCLVIVLVLCSLALLGVSSIIFKLQTTGSLNNLKTLHLVDQQMALDGVTKGDTNLGWPGDTGGSFTNWEARIVKGGYLTTNDLCRMLSAAGCFVPLGKIPPMNETAVRVYAVTKDSTGDAVIFTSGNFTNTPTGGEPLSPSAKPFGNKGFVVFRKGGDGGVYLARQVGQTNLIGSFVPMCR